MSSFVNYLRETRAEMKHVSWPTKEQALGFTLVVILISVLVALMLFVFDSAFLYLLLGEKI